MNPTLAWTPAASESSLSLPQLHTSDAVASHVEAKRVWSNKAACKVRVKMRVEMAGQNRGALIHGEARLLRSGAAHTQIDTTAQPLCSCDAANAGSE